MRKSKTEMSSPDPPSAARSFLAHRRYVVEHLKRIAESPGEHLKPALHHARAALGIAVSTLELRKTSPENPAPLRALYDTALSLLKCAHDLNAQAGVLFDEEVCAHELSLEASGAALCFSDSYGVGKVGGDRVPLRNTPLAACALCGSGSDLDEDMDSPGIFYCVPCWLAYDSESTPAASDLGGQARASERAQISTAVSESEGSSIERTGGGVDKSAPYALVLRSRGVAAHSVGELLALRSCSVALCPLRDRFAALGHISPDAVDAVAARLPQPWAPSGKAKKGGSSKQQESSQASVAAAAKKALKREKQLAKKRAATLEGDCSEAMCSNGKEQRLEGSVGVEAAVKAGGAAHPYPCVTLLAERVAYFKQTTTLNCGPTCLRMMITTALGEDVGLAAAEQAAGILEGKIVTTLDLALGLVKMAKFAKVAADILFVSISPGFNVSNVAFEKME